MKLLLIGGICWLSIAIGIFLSLGHYKLAIFAGLACLLNVLYLCSWEIKE